MLDERPPEPFHDIWMYHLDYRPRLFREATRRDISSLKKQGWKDHPDKCKQSKPPKDEDIEEISDKELEEING